MAKKEKNRWVGIILGPGLVGLSLMALWKNETRFDYHKAAARTPHVESPTQATDGERFGYTGDMDQEMTMPGKYVEAFTGYLVVWRSAEIYCWDKDEDDDGVKWSKRWMSGVENNSRNNGIRQTLQSGTVYPDQYIVGELSVQKDSIEFVDEDVNLDPRELKLSGDAAQRRLQPNQGYFYLRKGKMDHWATNGCPIQRFPSPRPRPILENTVPAKALPIHRKDEPE